MLAASKSGFDELLHPSVSVILSSKCYRTLDIRGIPRAVGAFGGEVGPLRSLGTSRKRDYVVSQQATAGFSKTVPILVMDRGATFPWPHL